MKYPIYLFRLLPLIGCLLDTFRVDAQSPIDIGTRKQLFIDQRFIASSNGIELRMNPAQKLGLILGTAFVELRDANGKPIPGFTLAECEEIGGNFFDQLEGKDGCLVARRPPDPPLFQADTREALRISVSRGMSRFEL